MWIDNIGGQAFLQIGFELLHRQTRRLDAACQRKSNLPVGIDPDRCIAEFSQIDAMYVDRIIYSEFVRLKGRGRWDADDQCLRCRRRSRCLPHANEEEKNQGTDSSDSTVF